MTDHSENNILKLARRFRDMEVKYNLFNLQTKDGIYFWDILRYHVHLSVLSEKGFFPNVKAYMNKPAEPKSKRLLKALRLLPLFIINEFRWIFLRKKKKYVFLLNSRFQDANGNPEDSLIKDIHDQLKADSFELEIFRHKKFGWLKRNIGSRYFLYKLEMRYLLGRNHKDEWSDLSKIINEEFEINIYWQETFHVLLNKYRKEYIFFYNVFKKVKPKFLFFQSLPKGMIAAANDLKITSIDLQHGHTNKGGVLYSYPTKIDLNHISSIPRIFLTLGKFWNNQIDFPFKIITSGNSYFNIQQDKNIKERKGIMVVSVAFTHGDLQQATANLAKNHPDLIFYYKLHSNQKHQEQVCRNYFNAYPNVKVIYTEEGVKEIMDKCFAIIVIQTSVIYQALQKGLAVFIFKWHYYEMSYDVFNEKGVFLVRNWEDISRNLSTGDWGNFAVSTVFFEPYQPSTITALIN
jgi:hypothetical protein